MTSRFRGAPSRRAETSRAQSPFAARRLRLPSLKDLQINVSKRSWTRRRFVKKDADYRERLRAAGRRYRDSHKEELRARRRRRWKVDPAYRERIGAAQRRYRESHKEELREPPS
jgi:hypothetical protein